MNASPIAKPQSLPAIQFQFLPGEIFLQTSLVVSFIDFNDGLVDSRSWFFNQTQKVIFFWILLH